MIAWTPLEPYKTFKDDPLRILRTIRFTSRFDLTIAPEIEEVLKTKTDLLTSLANKISVEWISMELDKMMSDKNASWSFKLLIDLNIF